MPKQKSSALVHADEVAGGALPLRCEYVMFTCSHVAEPRSLLADSWPQALALLADPRAAPTALALLNDVVDTAWHAAGDCSSDFSW